MARKCSILRVEKLGPSNAGGRHLYNPPLVFDHLYHFFQIYRKRFAAEAREADSHAIFYDSYGMDGNGAAKFRRTKPFPPVIPLQGVAIPFSFCETLSVVAIDLDRDEYLLIMLCTR